MFSEKYEDAIADCYRALRIDPDDAVSYAIRAYSKQMSYCSDYKKACDLGDSLSCDYYQECK